MKLALLLSLSSLTSASALPTSSLSSADFKIPTSYESAILARRILALTPLATLSTIFPSSSKQSSPSVEESRPANLGNTPLGLIEYIADCDPSRPGNPTILALNIATAFKNIAAGNTNVSLSLSWTPPHLPDKRIQSSSSSSWLSSLLPLPFLSSPSSDQQQQQQQTKFSAANLPRFSLHGWIDPLPSSDRDSPVAKCFVGTHPDAKYWLPGNRIHEAHFVRFVVEHVYWIGGFGDRAYIGWITKDEWNNVTRQEWESARLPGEKKGWKEWSLSGQEDL